MISIYKISHQIIVRYTNSESIDMHMIKKIVGTIKRIDMNNQQPCQIVIKEYSKIQFTKTGEQFYKRIFRRKILDSNRTRICLE